MSRAGAPGAERVYLALVAEHQTAILNYLYRLVGDADVAEDLAQETYVKAWRALERLELDEAAEARRRAWIYRIAHNAALDHLRRKTRFRWLGLDSLRGGSGDPAARTVAAAPVRQALDRLDVEQRQLLLLFNHEGLSATEVAEVLGITAAAARKRRQRAGEAFREIYTALEAAPPRGTDEDRGAGDEDRGDGDRDDDDSSDRDPPDGGVGRSGTGSDADPSPRPGGTRATVSCDRCRALLAEAPIEALTPEDRARVEAHVAGCPDCDLLVETDRLVSAGLAPERRLAPSRALQQALLEIPRRDRRQRWLAPLMLPLAMAFCALSSWLIWSLGPDLGRQTALDPGGTLAMPTRLEVPLGTTTPGGPGQAAAPEARTATAGASTGAGLSTSPRARAPLATLAAAFLGRPSRTPTPAGTRLAIAPGATAEPGGPGAGARRPGADPSASPRPAPTLEVGIATETPSATPTAPDPNRVAPGPVESPSPTSTVGAGDPAQPSPPPAPSPTASSPPGGGLLPTGTPSPLPSPLPPEPGPPATSAPVPPPSSTAPSNPTVSPTRAPLPTAAPPTRPPATRAPATATAAPTQTSAPPTASMTASPTASATITPTLTATPTAMPLRRGGPGSTRRGSTLGSEGEAGRPPADLRHAEDAGAVRERVVWPAVVRPGSRPEPLDRPQSSPGRAWRAPL